MLNKPLLPEWRYWPAVPLAALILIAILGGYSSLTPKPGAQVESPSHNQHQPDTSKNNNPSFFFKVADNHDAIEAIAAVAAVFAAIALVVVTGYLWKATRDLAISTGDLAKGATDQVRETARANELAEKHGLIALAAHDLSQHEFELNRTKFEAEHRPWVPVIDARIIAPGLTWASGNVLVGIELVCRNIGNSPARRVSLIAGIRPGLASEKVAFEIVAMQDRHRTRNVRDLREQTIFQTGLATPLSDVLIISHEIVANLKDGLGEPAEEMLPMIIGSVAYYFSFGDETPHYTPFAFSLWRNRTAGTGAIAAIPLDGNNLGINELVLLVASSGDAT